MNGETTEPPAEEPEWQAELRDLYPRWRPPDPRDPDDMLAACEYWWDDFVEIAEEHDRRDVTQDVQRLIATLKALARCAETNGLSAAPLIRCYQDLEGFSCMPQSDIPAAGQDVQTLLEHLKIKLEVQQPSAPSPLESLPVIPPPVLAEPASAEPPPPRVVLYGPGKQPVVLGKKKPVLSQAQYNVVQTLLPAGEAGLSKDEFESKSGHQDARRILKRLFDSDPDWAEVIHLPGRKGKRYRIF